MINKRMISIVGSRYDNTVSDIIANKEPYWEKH